MHLALLMHCTVEELQERMTYEEFQQWLALMEIEPVGEQRMDLRFAMLSALIANVNRDAQKRPQAYKLEDFLPDFWNERPAPSLRDKFMLLAAAINAQNGSAP